MSQVIQLPAWKALQQHHATIRSLSMRDAFTQDPGRAKRYSLTWDGVFLDYSKNPITDETLCLLLQLAEEAGVADKIQSMFRGDKINTTEQRAVLHTALRNRGQTPIKVDAEAIMPKVQAVLTRMGHFSRAVHLGELRGFTGHRITDIVNLGIGGSDLGPQMVCQALQPFTQPGLNVHFVSNVDGAALNNTLRQLRPDSTLFIIASKTFTTQETLTNALSARAWLLEQARAETAIAKHFVAVSANLPAVTAFGIDLDYCFEFWDWVGGRYSLWSAIGLPIMLALGEAQFIELLSGAYAMDQHFAMAPLENNLPVILALLGIWQINFYGASSQVIAPYNQALSRFPAFIQQLEMESNGKSVTLQGQATAWDTAPVIFGETGINGQHAYFQLLHQGPRVIPVDFIASLDSRFSLPGHHAILLANLFAQAEALMRGKNEAEVRLELAHLSPAEQDALLPHKLFRGNRPSNTILLDCLDPYHLGMLVALYEHKTFVQGAIWGINSFDQWGVELGKQLAKTILAELTTGIQAEHDSSTQQLIARYRQVKERS